ncbi:MAG TPA: hypothetical protein HA304_04485 [Methanosarcinales archaeon]|nr:hypothetical protein [Methanosarcinales archaeon]
MHQIDFVGPRFINGYGAISYLILSEPVTTSMLAGGALILLGVVIISR